MLCLLTQANILLWIWGLLHASNEYFIWFVSLGKCVELTTHSQKINAFLFKLSIAVNFIDILGSKINCDKSPLRFSCMTFYFYSHNLCLLNCSKGRMGYFYSEKGYHMSQAEGTIHDQNAMAFIIFQLTPKWLAESCQMVFSLNPCLRFIWLF